MYRLLVISTVVLLGACNGNDGGGANQDVLSVSITLDSLPQTITYNKTGTPDGYAEYEWGVIFDINGDGAINQDDVALKVLHYKRPGSVETSGAIAGLDANLWLYTSNTQTKTVAKASSQIDGNTITITIPKSADSSLKSITDSTLVNFMSATYDSNAGYTKWDYYPSSGAVVNIPVDGMFADSQGDVDIGYIDMVSMSITL